MGEAVSHGIDHRERGIRIRHKELDDVARARDFRGRREKVRDRLRRAVPHARRKPFMAQCRRHPGSNDAETNDPDVDARALFKRHGSRSSPEPRQGRKSEHQASAQRRE